MSYLAMTAAPIEYSNNSDKNSTQAVIDNLKKMNKQNRTRRRAISKIDKPHNESISDIDVDEIEDNNNLGDFKPLPVPESAGVERRKEREVISDDERNEIQNQQVSSYTKLSNSQSEQPARINDVEMGSDINTDEYKNKIAPYYQQNQKYATQQQGQNNDLTEKLNYLIHLLEEQQDEKTENVTEEVILYSFLGIFIIFVVDSFARVGKYVR